MNEDKIRWCLRQNKGIRVIELKPHLCTSYIKEADETLENVFTAKGKWKVIIAYYACYNALYSVLMKTGIKCEIHDCTLELMELFDFDNYDIDYIKKLKEDRIQAQYYLKNVALEDETKIKKFILNCKTVLDSLSSRKIEEIRARIENKIGGKD